MPSYAANWTHHNRYRQACYKTAPRKKEHHSWLQQQLDILIHQVKHLDVDTTLVCWKAWPSSWSLVDRFLLQYPWSSGVRTMRLEFWGSIKSNTMHGICVWGKFKGKHPTHSETTMMAIPLHTPRATTLSLLSGTCRSSACTQQPCINKGLDL